MSQLHLSGNARIAVGLSRLSARLAAVFTLFASALTSVAGPAGATVVRGSATFDSNGLLTTITAANSTIVDYSSFNINANETVVFVQAWEGASRHLNGSVEICAKKTNVPRELCLAAP